MEATRYNIRYVGFESLADGARRLDYVITSRDASARYARFHIPAEAFSGTGRVSFQDTATVCYEKLRRELETETDPLSSFAFTLTAEDIEQFRPKRRAAGKKA